MTIEYLSTNSFVMRGKTQSFPAGIIYGKKDCDEVFQKHTILRVLFLVNFQKKNVVTLKIFSVTFSDIAVFEDNEDATFLLATTNFNLLNLYLGKKVNHGFDL